MYRLILDVPTQQATSSGIYTCTVTVKPTAKSMYVNGSEPPSTLCLRCLAVLHKVANLVTVPIFPRLSSLDALGGEGAVGLLVYYTSLSWAG